jgi:hypothetical protein
MDEEFDWSSIKLLTPALRLLSLPPSISDRVHIVLVNQAEDAKLSNIVVRHLIRLTFLETITVSKPGAMFMSWICE